MDCEAGVCVEHECTEEGNDEVSLPECHRGVQHEYELHGHCQPATRQLLAGPLDAAAEVVVVSFYVGYWCYIC